MKLKVLESVNEVLQTTNFSDFYPLNSSCCYSDQISTLFLAMTLYNDI